MIRKVFKCSECDRVVKATDMDPTGESTMACICKCGNEMTEDLSIRQYHQGLVDPVRINDGRLNWTEYELSTDQDRWEFYYNQRGGSCNG